MFFFLLINVKQTKKNVLLFHREPLSPANSFVCVPDVLKNCKKSKHFRNKNKQKKPEDWLKSASECVSFEACGPRGWTVENEERNRVTHSRNTALRWFSMYPLPPILTASGIHLFSCDSSWHLIFFSKFWLLAEATTHRFIHFSLSQLWFCCQTHLTSLFHETGTRALICFNTLCWPICVMCRYYTIWLANDFRKCVMT